VNEKPILLWDAGPGEIRAGLVEDGKLTEFRIIRLRRGEKALYQAGERYTARIIERTGRTAIVDLGLEQALLDPAPKGYNAGQLVSVTMTRSRIPEPGRWKPAKVRLADDPTPAHAEPCWHFSAEPWELYLRAAAPHVSVIICPDVGVACDVEREVATPTRVDPQMIADAGFDDIIDTAISGQFALDGQGSLSIERTRAMTMIDVDGMGDGEALNIAAARAVPGLLRLLDIGGATAIDFVSMENRAARQNVADAFDAAAANLGQHERTAVNGFGLMQIIRPRTGPSVPEILCETSPGRLSLESRAIALLREAGRSQGIGPRHLVAPPAIIDLIRTWPEETGALRFSLGTEIILVPDSAITGYGHVHVAQA
jgi:ribonuclease G